MFHAAIRKYGESAFQWVELLKCESLKAAMDKEIELIAELKPEYNITRGGQGIVGVPSVAHLCAATDAVAQGGL